MSKSRMKKLLKSVEKALIKLSTWERTFIPGQYAEMLEFVTEIKIGDRVMRVIVVEADLADEFSGANEQCEPSAQIIPFKGPTI